MIDKKSYKVSEETDNQKLLKNTHYYLENYLNPNRSWNRLVSPKERINRIRHSNVNWKTVSDHIRNMKYQDFLRTPYWKAIASYSKFRARYRCQVCNSAYDLATHHRNYGIHGAEHAHIHELIVLCNDCHSKFHGKPPKSKIKTKVTLIILIMKLIAISILVIWQGFFQKEILIKEAKSIQTVSTPKKQICFLGRNRKGSKKEKFSLNNLQKICTLIMSGST